MPDEAVILTADLKLQRPTTAERQIRDIERNLFKGTARAAEPLGRLTGKVSEFDKSLEAANARVIAFGASAGVIAGITTAMQLMVTQTIKVEKALLDINVLLGQSSSGLEKFSDSLFDVAKKTGQSFFDVAEAAKEFSRQGLGVQETLSRTSDAMILARLTGLDFTKSVEQLTASVNQFSKEALTTADVVNRLANVDAKFAVSAKDLSEGLSRAGSVAQDAGASFNELIALITAVQQRTARGGAVIANGLKTIFTRVQRADTLDSLEELGIGVRDVQGNTLPAIQILSELSKKYDSLSSAQKAFTSELVGGGYQINIVKSLFDDLGRPVSEYSKALRVASQSSDEAYQRNELLNKSLSSLANEAGQNLTKLAVAFGSLTFEPALKRVFSVINGLGSGEGGSFKEIGSKIGTGILAGLGEFIGGPGLVYLLALAGKLFTKFGKFAKDSIGEVLSLGTPNAKILDTQKGIVDLLRSDIEARNIINSTVTTQLQKEQQLVALIRERVALESSAKSSQIGLARSLVSQGVVYKPSTGSFKTKAGGHMPLPLSAIPQEAIAKEVIGAKQAGYNIQPSNVRAMRALIDGKQTTVVYNNKEKVIHDYMGSGEPAIIPPTGRIANYAWGNFANFPDGVFSKVAYEQALKQKPKPITKDEYESRRKSILNEKKLRQIDQRQFFPEDPYLSKSSIRRYQEQLLGLRKEFYTKAPTPEEVARDFRVTRKRERDKVRLKKLSTGSYVDIALDRKNKSYYIEYLSSRQKGDGRSLFGTLAEKASAKKYSIQSGSLVRQGLYQKDIGSVEELYKAYPQLRYRKGLGRTELSTYDKSAPFDLSIPYAEATKTRKFSSLEELEDYVSKYPLPDPGFENLKTVFYAGGRSVNIGGLNVDLGGYNGEKLPRTLRSFRTISDFLRNNIGLKKGQIAPLSFGQNKLIPDDSHGAYLTELNKVLVDPTRVYKNLQNSVPAPALTNSLYDRQLSSIVGHEYFHNAYTIDPRTTDKRFTTLADKSFIIPKTEKEALQFIADSYYGGDIKAAKRVYKDFAREESLAIQFPRLLGLSGGRVPKYKNFSGGAKFPKQLDYIKDKQKLGNVEFKKKGGALILDMVTSARDAEGNRMKGTGVLDFAFKQLFSIAQQQGIKEVGMTPINGRVITKAQRLFGPRDSRGKPIDFGNDIRLDVSKYAGRVLNSAGGYVNAALGLPLQTYNREELLIAAEKLGVKIPERLINKSDNEIARFLGSSRQHQALVSRGRRLLDRKELSYSGLPQPDSQVAGLATTRGFRAQSRLFEAIDTPRALTAEQRALKGNLERLPTYVKSSSIDKRREQLKNMTPKAGVLRVTPANVNRGVEVVTKVDKKNIDRFVERYTAPRPGIQYSAPIGPEPYSPQRAEEEYQKQKFARDTAAQRNAPKVRFSSGASQRYKDLEYYQRAGIAIPSIGSQAKELGRSVYGNVKSFSSRAQAGLERFTGFASDARGTSDQKRERFAQRAFGASFIAPMIASGVAQFSGFDDKTDQRFNRAVQGVGTSIGTGAAVGATIGGPYGAIIGGVVGAFGSLKSILDNLNPSLEDLTEKIGKDAEEREKGISALAAYSQVIQELESPNLSEAQRLALSKKANIAASALTSEERATLAGSSNRLQTSQDLIAKRSSEKDVSTAVLSFPAVIKKLSDEGFKNEGLGSQKVLNALLDTSAADFSKIDIADLESRVKDVADLQREYASRGLNADTTNLLDLLSKVGVSGDVLSKASTAPKQEQNELVRSVIANLTKEVKNRAKLISPQDEKQARTRGEIESIQESIKSSQSKLLADIEVKNLKSSNVSALDFQRKSSELDRRAATIDFLAPQLSNRAKISLGGRLDLDRAALEQQRNIENINRESASSKLSSLGVIQSFLASADKKVLGGIGENNLNYVRAIQNARPGEELDSVRNLQAIGRELEKNATSPETKEFLKSLNSVASEQLVALEKIDKLTEEQLSFQKAQLEATKADIKSKASSEQARAAYREFIQDFSPSAAGRGQLSFSEIAAAAEERARRGIFDKDSNRAKNESIALQNLSGRDRYSLASGIRARNIQSTEIQARGIEQEFDTGGLLRKGYVESLAEGPLKAQMMQLRKQKEARLASLNEARGAYFIRQQFSASASPFLGNLSAGLYSNGNSAINPEIGASINEQLQSGQFESAISRLRKLAPNLNAAGRQELNTLIPTLQAGKIRLDATKTRAANEAQIRAGGGEKVSVFIQGLSEDAAAAIRGDDKKDGSVTPASTTNTVTVNVAGDASKQTAQVIADEVLYKLNFISEKLGIAIPPKAVA